MFDLMSDFIINFWIKISFKIKMAFRSTTFDPMDGQQLRRNDPSVDFASMEKNLAKEMARMKIVDEKKKREIEKICSESEELKDLQ